MPSVLRRVGSVACVGLLLAGVLGGCAPKKAATTAASASPSAAVSTKYAQSATLSKNLASIDGVVGSIDGTMTIRSEAHTLSGSVALIGGNSHVRLAVDGTSPVTYAETVVAGHRYASPDDKLFIDRGTKPAGTGLAAMFAAADTGYDAGVGKVGGITAHQIVSAQDKVDVAPALGLDTGTFDQETTTLRIWADDSGNVLGFGASMSWRELLGGAYQVFATEVDIVFAATKPDAILAPKNPWAWKENRPDGIAFGYSTNSSDVGTTVQYIGSNVGKETLSQVTKDVVDKMKDTPSGTQSVAIDSEDAFWFTVDRSKEKDHIVVLVVVHETEEYEFIIYGAAADKAKVDAQALQVFSTIEFTR